MALTRCRPFVRGGEACHAARGQEKNDRGQRGQATVEYALVLLAFLATIVSFCALWRQAQEGSLQRRAREAAAHNLDDGVSVGLLQDLAAY